MELTFLYKNLQKSDEGIFNDYVQQKVDMIELLLTKFADDAKILKASIEKFDKHDAYQVEFCLVLPTKSIIATETSHSINKAVDLSKDRLVSQIKKHLSHLRKQRSHASIRDNEVLSKELHMVKEI